MSVWDGGSKKRVRQFAGYSRAIAGLSFSGDGQRLAIASSDVFENGAPSQDAHVFVRDV